MNELMSASPHLICRFQNFHSLRLWNSAINRTFLRYPSTKLAKCNFNQDFSSKTKVWSVWSHILQNRDFVLRHFCAKPDVRTRLLSMPTGLRPPLQNSVRPSKSLQKKTGLILITSRYFLVIWTAFLQRKLQNENQKSDKFTTFFSFFLGSGLFNVTWR